MTGIEPGAFFDTNVIVYFVSEDSTKAHKSAELLKAGGLVSVQVLNEFAWVVRRKFRFEWTAIRLAIEGVRETCDVLPLTLHTHNRGLAIAERHRLNLYDGMLLAAALLAGCSTLYTEDLHDGLTIDGLTIRNPYAGLR
jgi:predicted nucleic acid-binding protein